MNTEKFKPMRIAVNLERQRDYEYQLSTFLAVLSDFWNEVEKFITITNKNEFKGNFYNEFKQQFSKVYSEKFPSIVPLDKQIELANVNTNKLKFLSDKLNDFKHIDIDLNTNNIKEVDFGLYTSNENENRLLTFLNSLVDKIHEAEGFTTIHKGQIQHGFNNAIVFDHSTQQFKPNYYFVTNQIR